MSGDDPHLGPPKSVKRREDRISGGGGVAAGVLTPGMREAEYHEANAAGKKLTRL